jgi:hypothetical protein
MLRHNLVIKETTKDPETFTNIQGYVLTEEIRERIGTNLLKLFGETIGQSTEPSKPAVTRLFPR